VLAGIELIHMIRKGQFAIDGADAVSLADRFSVGRNDPFSLSGTLPFRRIPPFDQQRDRTMHDARFGS
jgi:hypothetical protein